MSDPQDEYWSLFQEEGLQTLQTAEQALLSLEQSNDIDSLQSLYRAMHTLKGNCGMMGLPNLSHLTHKAEDLTESLKHVGIDQEESPIDLLLSTFDLIQELFPNVIEQRTDLTEEQINPYVSAISYWLSKYSSSEEKQQESDATDQTIEQTPQFELHSSHPLLEEDMQEVFIDTLSTDLEQLERSTEEEFYPIIHAMLHSCEMMQVEPVVQILKKATYDQKDQIVFQCTNELSDILSMLDVYDAASKNEKRNEEQGDEHFQRVKDLVFSLRDSVRRFKEGEEKADSEAWIQGELLVQEINVPRVKEAVMNICLSIAEEDEIWTKEGDFLEVLIEWEQKYHPKSHYFEEELSKFHSELIPIHLSQIQHEYNSSSPDHKRLAMVVRSLTFAAKYNQQHQASMLFLQLSDGFERHSYGEPVPIEELESMLIQLSNGFSELLQNNSTQHDFDSLCVGLQRKIEALSRGSLAQVQRIYLKGVPPNIIEALTEESYQQLQLALENSEILYLIQADLEASEQVSNYFVSWLSKRGIRLITSGTLYIEDRTEFAFLISSMLSKTAIQKDFQEIDPSNFILRLRKCGEEVTEKVAKKETHFKPLSVRRTSALTKKIKTHVLRVQVDKIATMMDLAGEIGLSFGKILHDPKIKAIVSKELEENIRQLSMLIAQLQDATIGLRLMPISEIFHRMNRVARDASSGTDKKVSILLEGEDTELDKMMVERLHSPLVHLIRNCIDHGIESPEEREILGKEPTGTIILKAQRKSSEIHITIQDNGRGLDRNKIERKARARGLLTTPNPTPKQIENCIFEPGFSTSDVVTKVSGRGMGMDVVKMEVNALRGSIEIESTPGEGTTTILILPLTVAFISSMVTKIGNMNYAFPIEFVKSVQFISEETTLQLSKSVGILIEYQQHFVPIYGIEHEEDIRNKYVLLLKNKAGWLAYPITDLPRIQQVVIKPLTPPLDKIPNRSSFGLLPNGELAMVMDVESLSA